MVSLRARPGGMPVGAILLGIGLVGGATVAVFGLDRLPFPVCAFKAITGWPCLTCGSTRAVSRLVQADVIGALAMNPLVATVALAIVPWGLADLMLLARRRAVGLSLTGGAAVVARAASVALVLANWAYLIAARR
jgi:hypothetical protein